MFESPDSPESESDDDRLPKPGTDVLGKYRVTHLLGSGGMGMVFAAQSIADKRDVALKYLLPGLSGNQAARERLLAEFSIMKLLRHENVIEVEVIENLVPPPFIVMEALRGRSLNDELRRRVELDPKVAVEIAIQTLRGIAAAHAKEIVHGDIKPSNVFLCIDTNAPMGFRVKVLDFGIANYSDLTTQHLISTFNGSEIQPLAEPEALVPAGLRGSPPYMPPELLEPDARRIKADKLCDIYSVGVLLYELLNRNRPFGGSNREEVFEAMRKTPRPPLPRRERSLKAIGAVVLSALAQEPKRRPATAMAFIRQLERARAPSRWVPYVSLGVAATAMGALGWLDRGQGAIASESTSLLVQPDHTPGSAPVKPKAEPLPPPPAPTPAPEPPLATTPKTTKKKGRAPKPAPVQPTSADEIDDTNEKIRQHWRLRMGATPTPKPSP